VSEVRPSHPYCCGTVWRPGLLYFAAVQRAPRRHANPDQFQRGELWYAGRTIVVMDELATPANGQDRIDVTRSMISQGQAFRLRLRQVDDTTVSIDLRIGEDASPVGSVQGQLRVADMVPASRALTYLLSGSAQVLGRPESSTAGSAKIQRLRQKYPNAYKTWTEEEDKKLMELYRSKVGVPELAKTFGRKTSAITARLERVLPPEALSDDPEDGPTPRPRPAPPTPAPRAAPPHPPPPPPPPRPPTPRRQIEAISTDLGVPPAMLGGPRLSVVRASRRARLS
jgi:hypothetical protein